MKKSITLISLITILFALVFSLAGCSGSDTPDGMQLVAGGESLGYYFYAPEEWTPSSVGEIKAAYISRVDPTSVSFAEVKTFATMPDGIEKSEYFFNSYFKDSLAEFPDKNPPKVAKETGEEIIFGKEGETADKAKKYTYTFEYFDTDANETFKFGIMQILIQEADRYYIFTYTASMEEKLSGTTTYDYYLGDGEDEGKVQQIISEFRFVPITEKEEAATPEVDGDGFVLVSDEDLSGFSLYVPPTFSQDYASAIVSATHADGSNITFTEAKGTNENVNSYMRRRLAQLAEIVDKDSLKYAFMLNEDGNYLADPEGEKIIAYKTIEFGNADAANAYEYSFTYNGSEYHVYQVIAVEGWTLSYRGYVFTYTAKEANYSLHFDDVMKTIEKVDFK